LKITSAEDNKVSLHVHGELKPLLAVLAKADVTSLSTRELDLEEEFMRYYEAVNK
jgi:hypothetical protein